MFVFCKAVNVEKEYTELWGCCDDEELPYMASDKSHFPCNQHLTFVES